MSSIRRCTSQVRLDINELDGACMTSETWDREPVFLVKCMVIRLVRLSAMSTESHQSEVPAAVHTYFCPFP